MRLPRYWAKGAVEVVDAQGKQLKFECFGWSDASRDDAERVGRERAQHAAELHLRGAPSGEPIGAYGYADRPLREERLREIGVAGADSYAVITRNAYGCQVLNTDRAMFVDIDLPEPPKPAGGAASWLKRLFGRAPDGPPPDPPDTAALAEVERFARRDARVGLRIYRTRAGLRLLLTHAPIDPKAQAARDMMASLGADPLYVNLCRIQECFRARLTPKPWRCGHTAFRGRYPWPDELTQRAFAKWEAAYQRASEPYATCQFVKALGERRVHPDIAPIVALHDEMTRAESGLPLA